MKKSKVIEYLEEHNVKPSVQRIAVMDYLMTHRTHPTVDEIYHALEKQIPTLSKTTVYNTLKLFVEKEAALLLTIDERNSCFDGCCDPHAHFLCTECFKIYDLPLEEKVMDYKHLMPEGFDVQSVNLYYRGVCEDCKKKKIN